MLAVGKGDVLGTQCEMQKQALKQLMWSIVRINGFLALGSRFFAGVQCTAFLLDTTHISSSC